MTHQEHHATLVAYLKAKVEAADWHGVSDAANDLRVLEAQHGLSFGPGATPEKGEVATTESPWSISKAAYEDIAQSRREQGKPEPA